MLAAEYSWPLAEILRLPLRQVLCFHAAILERHEIKTGTPSFTERDILASITPTDLSP